MPDVRYGMRANAAALLLLVAQGASAQPLPSWNEGPAKRAIVDFVTAVTREDGPDFVLPAARIAVFDNDGTLWAEKPMPFQFLFALDRVKVMAPQHQEWKTTDPFASVLRGNPAGVAASGEKGVMQPDAMWPRG